MTFLLCFHISVSVFPFPCQSALLFVTERCPCFSLVSQISSSCLKWNWACYSTTDRQLAKLSLNPLSRKCFSGEKRAEVSPTLSLSFRRRADADCNGVVMLMLVLTSWTLKSPPHVWTTRFWCQWKTRNDERHIGSKWYHHWSVSMKTNRAVPHHSQCRWLLGESTSYWQRFKQWAVGVDPWFSLWVLLMNQPTVSKLGLYH